MQKHEWIVEVCADLLSYAKDHKLKGLEAQLQVALKAAQHDVLLAAVDAFNDTASDYAILGTDLAARARTFPAPRDPMQPNEHTAATLDG